MLWEGGRDQGADLCGRATPCVSFWGHFRCLDRRTKAKGHVTPTVRRIGTGSFLFLLESETNSLETEWCKGGGEETGPWQKRFDTENSERGTDRQSQTHTHGAYYRDEVDMLSSD